MPPSSTPFEAIKDDADDLVFLEEQSEIGIEAGPAPGRPVWRVMIVDDDEDVHATTTFALGNLDMQHRPLEFVHAYSAAEARALLQREPDIAVILLDVVMEDDDAGLHLVRLIRETLQLTQVRIILRTGQPGYAPEIDAIRDFDINDYKTKSELTRIKLYTTVTAAIRSYAQIRAIDSNRRGLDHIVHAGSALMALQGVPDFAAGVLEQAAALLGMPAHAQQTVRGHAQAKAAPPPPPRPTSPWRPAWAASAAAPVPCCASTAHRIPIPPAARPAARPKRPTMRTSNGRQAPSAPPWRPTRACSARTPPPSTSTANRGATSLPMWAWRGPSTSRKSACSTCSAAWSGWAWKTSNW